MIPNFTMPYILLHPNIPKPMHRVTPRTVMGQEWWNDRRQEAYAKNNYCCWACGVWKKDALFHPWLEAHECYEINYQKGTMVLAEISALCHACHNYIHDGRMRMMVDSGEMSEEKYDLIMTHGDMIVSEIEDGLPWWLANTFASDVREGVAKWENWRLIVDGLPHGPKFKSYEEWLNHDWSSDGS